MERERLVSIVGARASRYVDLKTPSKIIPFKGNFPLLEPYQVASYYEAIQNTMNLEDLSEELQRVTEKGNRIALMEEGFKEYLESNRLSIEDFMKLKNSEKADKLIAWMNKDCIDFTQLTIK